jgi:exopolyphosphatase/guanosine-5'-triphosphate,3'-diphosphate pyrophosphatase
MSGSTAGKPIGAIDIGTNSVRLLIQAGADELAREVTITRLGARVDAGRRLDPAAVDRTLTCLADYRARLDEAGVEHLRAVATSVLRDAEDRDMFLDAAEGVLGVRPDVLSGAEEARLSFAGATAGLDRTEGPFVVLDIGGGSTEVSVGTDEPDGAISIDVGSVRLTERELRHDPPQPEELTNAIGLVEDQLDDVLRELPAVAEASTLVGVAGTIVTIAAVELGRYDRAALHHFVLTRDAAEDVFRTLATEALADRIHNPGLQRERADIIVGGACILVAVLRKLKAPQLLVSESDLLDALATTVG